MAYLFPVALAVVFVAALLLGLWLKRHPGHPVLQALDDAAKQEAEALLFQKVAQVAAAKGVVLSPPAPLVMSSGPATATPAPPTKQ